MTKKVVAIIGALDTKGAEYAFLKQQIEGQGVGTLMIDVGDIRRAALRPGHFGG